MAEIQQIDGTPGQDGWDWTCLDGTLIQLDSDLSHALVSIPDEIFQQHTQDFWLYGLDTLNQYAAATVTIPTHFVPYHTGGMDGTNHLLHYFNDTVPPEPTEEPVAAVVAPAQPAFSPSSSATYIKEIGDAIVSLTMKESDKLCTYLHSQGIKCVLATFGSNNNEGIDDIMEQVEIEAAENTVIESQVPSSSVPVDDMRYTPPSTSATMVLPVEQPPPPPEPPTEEEMWRSVYRKPLGLPDMKP